MSIHYEPVGVDFSAALVDGLRGRMAEAPPEAMARITLLLPTQRMARRVQEVFASKGAALLPRIGLVSDLAPLLPTLALPPTRSAGALVLELAQLVAPLLTKTDLAPESAVLDLADSLTQLLREMVEEGVGADGLSAIDPGPLAGHWQDTLRFLQIVIDLMATSDLTLNEHLQLRILDQLVASWEQTPPGQVIVAGSTGSRAPTARLMRSVARLPEGAVILPGLDCEMPEPTWHALDEDCQDHPQFRHRTFLEQMGMTRAHLTSWSGRQPVAPARNKLISLALRPPPATEAWMREGPHLADLAGACAGLTLVEAPSALAEAETIALRLREAATTGQRVALITPDRTLSREVTACLNRWDIVPDDSAGRPLSLTPPGRLVLQTAELLGRPVDGEALVALLKHPLTHTGGDRREHLRRTRILELGWLRGGPLHPTRDGFVDWQGRQKDAAPMTPWDAWLCEVLDLVTGDAQGIAPLGAHLDAHRALLSLVAGGPPTKDGSDGALWEEAAGRAAREVMDTLTADAQGADLSIGVSDYARYLHGLLSASEVRATDTDHPNVMIWGALEARVQGADLVILGGLNDGVWPALPGPDMWLSRHMRRTAGLRVPERTVGLSAHDFEQAIAGKEVWLTRATRSADAQTVPSRWVNRITNLLAGIGSEGQAALDAMRARGTDALVRADSLRHPQPRHAAPLAKRPAPKPPRNARRKQLSVTAIETLIRDPYAIYARTILGLRPLDPLRPPSDAAMRGKVVHEALAEAGQDATNAPALLEQLRRTMAEQIPSPAHRILWFGRFARIADAFAEEEAERRNLGTPALVEERGSWVVPGLDFTLTAQADRIDLRGNMAAVFDYKTGTPPTQKQQQHYAKQLLLEALMVEGGAFPQIGARPVQEIAYLGVGGQGGEPKTERTPLDEELRRETLSGLRDLVAGYLADAPFPARLAHEFLAYQGSYDHLARFGEWDDTQPFFVDPVG